MSFAFGTPNTQSGFTLGTAAQPAAAGSTGFTFGAAAAGAGDANKPAAPGQLFSTSFAAPKFGTQPAAAPTFGTPAAGTVGFGTPAAGATGFTVSQTPNIAANITPAANAAAPTGGLTFGTPIGTSTAVPTSQTSFPAFQPGPPSSVSSGLGTLAASSAAPVFNFNTNPAATTASTLNFNLGGTTATSGVQPASGINFGTPKLNAPGIITGTTAPASGGLTSLSFGAPAAAAPASGFATGIGGAPAATSATGFGIAGAAQTVVASGTAPTAVPTPASSAPGGFSLSGAPTQAAQTTGTSFSLSGTTTTTPAPVATGFSLGIPASSTSFSLGSTAPTTAAPAFNLGQTTVASSTPGFALGQTGAPAVSTAASTSTPQTSLGTATNVTSSTVATSQPTGLNFCQLEEAINKWTLELEEQEKVFVNQATQVNAWDRLLIANGEKIVTLNQEVERVKLEQQQLEHELDFVVGQQRELQDCLVPLEKELESVTTVDPEREYTYRLAENLNTQLKQMSEDLKEIIEHLNEANRSQDSSDPIVQIGKILNAHMNSLQWLDQRIAVLQAKIQQIDQMHQTFRQEHERSFSLAYN